MKSKRKIQDDIGYLVKRKRNTLDYILNYIDMNFNLNPLQTKTKSENELIINFENKKVLLNIQFNSFDQNNDVFVEISGKFTLDFFEYLLNFFNYSNEYLDIIHIDISKLENRPELINEMKQRKYFIFLEKLYYTEKLYNFDENEIKKLKNLDDDIIFPIKSINRHVNLFKLIHSYDFISNKIPSSLDNVKIISRNQIKSIIENVLTKLNLNVESYISLVDRIFQSFENEKKETKFDNKTPWISLKNYLFPYILYNNKDNLYINTNIIKKLSDLTFSIPISVFDSDKIFSSLLEKYSSKDILYIYINILGRIFNIIFYNSSIRYEIEYDLLNFNFFHLDLNEITFLNDITKYQLGKDIYMSYIEKNYNKSVCIVPYRNINDNFNSISIIVSILDNFSKTLNPLLIKNLYDKINEIDDKISEKENIVKNMCFDYEFEDIKSRNFLILDLYYELFDEPTKLNILFERKEKDITYKIFDGKENELEIDKLKDLISNCKKSQNFIIMSLKFSEESLGSGHANIILIDQKRGTAERYEPHGSYSYEEEILSDLSDKADLVLSNLFSQLNLKYVSPKECEVEGPQLLELPEYYDIQELSGFCVSWSFFQALYRIQHPEESYYDATSNFKKLFEMYGKEYGSQNIITGFFKREISKLYNNLKKDIDLINKKFNINIEYKI